MARKNKRIGRSVGRVVSYNAKRTLPKRLPLRLPFLRSIRLRQLEDRRTYYPEKVRPAASFSKPRHRLTVIDRVGETPNKFRGISQTKAIVAFKAPQKVLICARRQIRKEVLHAYNKAGKTGQRRPRRNEYSNVSCRR